jgi:hypothetical protein
VSPCKICRPSAGLQRLGAYQAVELLILPGNQSRQRLDLAYVVHLHQQAV